MEYIDCRKIDKDITKLANLEDDRLKYIFSICTNDNFQFTNKPGYIYYYTTKDEPFSLENSIFDSSLHINYDYYIDNTKEIIDKICSIIKSLTGDSISLCKEFITKETIESIVSNYNIKNVRLGFSDNYILEKNIYDILAKRLDIKEIVSFDVTDELSNNYDPRLTARMNKDIGNSDLKIKDLLNNSSFIVDSRDLLEVLEVIKHRTSEKDLNTITINITDYNNLNEFVREIIDKYKNVKIMLNIDFSNFKEDILNGLTEYENVVVKEESHEIPLELAIKKELKIRELLESVESIKDKLSPFEIYTKLYQIVKDFKPYKEVDKGDDLDKSRTLSKLLFNQYIVCAGYANLLQEFCKRYNIETYYMSVMVMPGYNKDLNKTLGHARLLVKMKDEKYDIDGLYVSDPTWDSNDNSKYNHILMTFDEIKRELKGEIPFNAYDFLNVKSKKEFYALANNPKARKYLNYLSFDIKDFDQDGFEKICKISSFNFDYYLENTTSLEKMADYCINFHQDIISGNSILKSLITIYKLENPSIDDKQIIEYFSKIKNNLKEREDIIHPTVVRESNKEKVFDFYDNKYSNVDVNDIVTNERKNTR